ncbi:pyrroline-5-carboxylate reductase [Oceanobacillus rekensis]|uniref:pyrroline-5-carboxylate reductase n=1 Tax=Oceanobacillus rekensis TaxID=937927 RepID=UPI000B4323EA|nr:pyrroline-5-carboxylate reductase [Oceanobacillus rekensis]
MNKKIAFLGAGSLAEALISGIIKSGLISKEKIYVTNKSNLDRLKYLEAGYQVQCRTNKEELAKVADLIVLAMKPKDAIPSIESIRPYLTNNQLIISVIAGLSTDEIERAVGIDIPVMRVMPNTSAMIGHSATALTPGKYVTDEHIKETNQLFQTVGLTKIVPEGDMHTVTAISGSGPAFIYYMVEAMEEAAIEMGLDAETASVLIAQTVIGAGKMLQQSGETPAVLRENITSTGGTTEAGLIELASHDFQRIVTSCINRARERSIEIGKSK